MNRLQKIIVVLGPTSSGKSDYAVALAHKVNGEVISADSRQVYKKLDIGTGKITKEEMKDIPHHMLDIVDVNDSFSVEEYTARTLPIIEDILKRGKVPIICGGTGQYIDAIMYENTFPQVKPNPTLRNELEKKTTEELYKELMSLDKKRAAAIDKHNRVRLIRAIEIVKELGKVPSQENITKRFEVTMYLLNPIKELLEQRVHKRLLKRFEAGMIDEMKHLIAKGYDGKVIAKRGIEYKYIYEYLQGNYTFNELIEKLRIATWQYAKRQRTWNKKYEDVAIKIEVTE
jgi:tRNA dimethylallyltransferase